MVVRLLLLLGVVLLVVVVVLARRGRSSRVVDVRKGALRAVVVVVFHVAPVFFQVHVGFAAPFTHVGRGRSLRSVVRHLVVVSWHGGRERWLRGRSLRHIGVGPLCTWGAVRFHGDPLLSERGPVDLLGGHGLVVVGPLVLGVGGQGRGPASSFDPPWLRRGWRRGHPASVVGPHGDASKLPKLKNRKL